MAEVLPAERSQALAGAVEGKVAPRKKGDRVVELSLGVQAVEARRSNIEPLLTPIRWNRLDHCDERWQSPQAFKIVKDECCGARE
jgi:hypothetical protein